MNVLEDSRVFYGQAAKYFSVGTQCFCFFPFLPAPHFDATNINVTIQRGENLDILRYIVREQSPVVKISA